MSNLPKFIVVISIPPVTIFLSKLGIGLKPTSVVKNFNFLLYRETSTSFPFSGSLSSTLIQLFTFNHLLHFLTFTLIGLGS